MNRELEFVFDYHRYPVVPVKFFYQNKETPLIEGLLDSGGDFIVLPMPIAKYLGLKLEEAGSVDTAGGAASLYKTNLTMCLGGKDKNVTYENLQIHVSCREDIPVLLGRQPIFEDYEIVFRKRNNQIILRAPPSSSQDFQ